MIFGAARGRCAPGCSARCLLSNGFCLFAAWRFDSAAGRSGLFCGRKAQAAGAMSAWRAPCGGGRARSDVVDGTRSRQSKQATPHLSCAKSHASSLRTRVAAKASPARAGPQMRPAGRRSSTSSNRAAGRLGIRKRRPPHRRQSQMGVDARKAAHRPFAQRARARQLMPGTGSTTKGAGPGSPLRALCRLSKRQRGNAFIKSAAVSWAHGLGSIASFDSTGLQKPS